MKTKITKIKGDWQEVVNDCRSTAGKEDIQHEPSAEFKREILLSEHSPIRDIHIKWKWPKIESWVATHFSRHMWECFIKSQRSDKTGVPRGELRQDEIVSFVGDANVQNLIDAMRKRLCFKASPETREFAEDLKMSISEVEPEIAEVLVPNCFYRGFCPEKESCGLWESMLNRMEKEDIVYGYKRYSFYNEWMKNRFNNNRKD